MKRAAVFAHYDKDSIVDDYVIYYIENLKKIADIVIFVSCNNLSNEEKIKLDVNHIISEEHNEYDFGSYKRGFFYLKENNMLNDIDELIFANDSCYAPLFPFEDMFDKMDNEQCDFWGVTQNKYGIKKRLDKNSYIRCVAPHVQSYFLVFKKIVYSSNVFNDFINSIRKLDNKNEVIINYEIGLSNILISAGYSYKTFITNRDKSGNLSIFKWKKLIKTYKSPFLKCNLSRGYNYEQVGIYDLEKYVDSYTKYPMNILKKNLARTGLSRKEYPCPDFLRKIFYTIIRKYRYIINNYFQTLIVKKR